VLVCRLHTFLEAGLALLAGLFEPLEVGFGLEAGALVAFAVAALVFGLVTAFFGFDSPVTACQRHLEPSRRARRIFICSSPSWPGLSS
jgi:hypothetical protein